MARGSAQELSPVCAYVALRTGTSLSVQQVARLQELLQRRLGRLSEEDYVEKLKTSAGAEELAELMASISVHKTDLFRDEVQLSAFDRHVLRPLAQRAGRPLHLWSAGCATGEEVATLLILLSEAGAPPGSSVLGTDLSAAALAQARTLAFQPPLLKRVPAELRQRYFSEVGGLSSLVPELRTRARFQQHNLMDFPYPQVEGGEGFDVIVCRNVLIYFTESAFARVVGGLAERLRPGGTLVLSAAEPLLRPHPRLKTLKCDQAFFYVKREEGEPSEPPTPEPSRRAGTFPRSAAAVAPAPVPPRSAPPASARAALAPAAPPVPAKPVPSPEAEDPLVEADRTFEQVMEWATSETEEARTEQGLRKCLYLDPHFAQARYLLGKLLEQKGQKADAASEYRRALSALNEGRSRQVAFYLNDERLKTACATALQRLGYR